MRNLINKDTAQNDDFLKTDHLLTNLRIRTISGGVVTSMTQGSKFLITLGSTILLARLLTPEDFGLIAMATSTTGILHVFKDAGLSTATIQKDEITHAQVSNLFWINVFIGFTMCLLISFCSPLIAWFFEDERLVKILIALSFTFFMRGLSTQHCALLDRQMRFKAKAIIEVGSMVFGYGTGIFMAFFGFGYWSLIATYVSLEGSAVFLTWFVSRWRPRWLSYNSGVKTLLRFGLNLSAGHLFSAMSRSMDTLLIGKFFGPVPLGLYSRAMALLVRPLEQCLSPINQIFVPALSRLQSNPERYRRMFLQAYNAIALIGFSVTGLLLALASPITLVLLGTQWGETAIIFAAFTPTALYFPLASCSNWLFTTQGRGKELLKASIVNSIVTVLAIAGGLPYGPVGVAISWSLSGLIIRLPYLLYIAGRNGPIHTIDLWSGILRHFPVWLLIFTATWAGRWFVIDSSEVVQLLVGLSFGTLAGLGAIWVLPYPKKTALQILISLQGFIGKKSHSVETTP